MSSTKNITCQIQKNLQCFYGEQPKDLPAGAKLTMTFVCGSVLPTA